MRYRIAPAIAILLCLTSARVTRAAMQEFRSGAAQVSLVELYTSEGCSSCPPAEAWFSRLVSDAGLWSRFVPVAFHVDYWDHLGWPDRLASAAYTRRQWQYAARWHVQTVYTPQLVLNGKDWPDWQRSPTIGALPTNVVGVLRLVWREGLVDAIFSPSAPPSKPLRVQAAILGFEITQAVAAGENRGRTLRHDFTVLDFASAPLKSDNNVWRATLPTRLIPAQPAARMALAAWVSDGQGGPVQAAGGWLDQGAPARRTE